MLLNLFSGCGGLDLGFEQAGFSPGLAFDIRPFSVRSWNRNRPLAKVGQVADIAELTLEDLDECFGEEFRPKGVIGGPPCQSFTNANSRKRANDPRALMVPRFFDLSLALHDRSELDFVVMENVPELASERYRSILDLQIERLEAVGFVCSEAVLDAYNFGVPQHRKRLFLVALNVGVFGVEKWQPPEPSDERPNVRHAIGHLPAPTYFSRELNSAEIKPHPNHWCMVPKSKKFTNGQLQPGKGIGRSFKMLDWERPSFTVSYGNREVHVHPGGKRRLSVYEALLLQGFPNDFVLEGNLSQQITQVSEAVPPPLAKAIAESIILRQSR